MKNKKRFDVISPDGFTIHYEKTYKSYNEAVKELDKWTKRYEQQGYYSSVPYGRIPCSELKDYCKIVEI